MVWTMENFAQTFQGAIDSACKLSTPKTTKRNTINNPWITPGLINSIDKHDRLRKNQISGNADNNNAIRCRKFGMLKMNRNVHSGTCSLMNFIARNFLGTTIRYKLTFPENLVKFGQKTWT